MKDLLDQMNAILTDWSTLFDIMQELPLRLTVNDRGEPLLNERNLAPNLIYFNRLYENNNYALKEVWILSNKEADINSTDPNDWIVYDKPNEIHFTNREASAGTNYILIEEGAVIRLVYDTTEQDYANNTTFYDYDITNGKIYSTEAGAQNQTASLEVTTPVLGGTYYAKTDGINGNDMQGINSAS